MKNTQMHERVLFKDMRDLMEQIGEKYGERCAFSYRLDPRDKEVHKKSYKELHSDVRAMATELIARGYTGKHICVVGKMSYNWAVSYYAIMCAGAVLVPLDKDWNAEDLSETAKSAEVSLIIADNESLAKAKAMAEAVEIGEPLTLDGDNNGIEELINSGNERITNGDRAYYDIELDPNKLALLVFTSGTTGKGKGVMLTQRNSLEDISFVIPYVDYQVKTIALLPPHHTFGSTITILGQNSLGCEIYISSGIRYVQRELLEQKPGHAIMVPLYLETFYRKIQAKLKDTGKEKLVRFMIKVSNGLRKIGIDIRRKLFKDILAAFGGEIRMVICGGAALNQEIADFFDAVGVGLINGYGITECAPVISVNHSKHIIKGSVGFPGDVVDVKIADPNEDGEGEICVKGPNVMLGYYKNEEATREAFDEEGYFKTGDYGKIGKEGELYITGRKKNLIILSNGKNVYPEEIESEFIAVPGLVDIVVYEGQSKRGNVYNAIVAEIYPDKDYFEKEKITDIEGYFKKFVDEYNKTAVVYKRIAILKVRENEFPKNTLRKIMRFKIDMTID